MPAELNTENEAGFVREYAIRRVNPFLGVLQVIETAGGRAISANGVVWDIEVRTEHGGGWGSLNRNNRQAAYYRYGLWSLEDGLVSRPLAPHLERDPLTQQCNVLIDCISERLHQLPFKLEDNLELWLFDSDDRQPLALLASVAAGSKRPSPEPKYWSSCIGAVGVASQRRFPAARELEAQVKQRAGFNIHKHWVIRQQDNSGIIESGKTRIGADTLQAFLLTEDWPEDEQATVVRQYLEWISPSLLTLQRLSRNERAYLEKKLSIQAISVEHHRHLYPEVIDEKHLTAARVQCRLLKSRE
jgi:hypothetical protein